ncbi:MAG: ribokinase [Clostridiales bacterium]|nr:ribokinase [Clostridiales bacterium]
MKKIGVIGSINADLHMRVPRFAQPGETLKGSAFSFFPGGKGANQAVAAARLGGEVYLAGCLGADPFGRTISESLSAAGVHCQAVEVQQDLPTGTAMIQVDDSGQNAICIVSGANDGVTPLFLRRVQAIVDTCDILLFQLEVPMEALLYAVKEYRRRGKQIILDPAPAEPLHNELLRQVDILTPNETELRQLTGIDVVDDASRLAACRALFERGVGAVLHKAGAQGAYLYDSGGLRHFPTYEVKVVDTTAAGDAFNGGLAHALARELPIDSAVEFANLVGAISTTALGAQSAMPTLAETEKMAQILHLKGR